MDTDIIENIKKILREDVKVQTIFGIGSYKHIESVANNAVELATLYQADVEVCEIAGWLHDIASITDYQLYENHHIHGANMAEKILKSYNYPTDKIELVKLCILNHRGSVLKEKQLRKKYALLMLMLFLIMMHCHHYFIWHLFKGSLILMMVWSLLKTNLKEAIIKCLKKVRNIIRIK